jgi:hypothetical protein
MLPSPLQLEHASSLHFLLPLQIGHGAPEINFSLVVLLTRLQREQRMKVTKRKSLIHRSQKPFLGDGMTSSP